MVFAFKDIFWEVLERKTVASLPGAYHYTQLIT